MRRHPDGLLTAVLNDTIAPTLDRPDWLAQLARIFGPWYLQWATAAAAVAVLL